MPYEWFNLLQEATTIAKAAPILALMSQIPQQDVVSAELKRMVNSYQFGSIIHFIEAVSPL